MKKKLVSLVLVAALVLAMCAPAFATTGFNQGVFNGRTDLTIYSDDMTGESYIYPSYDYYGSSYQLLSTTAFIGVNAFIGIDDYSDLFAICFDYTGRDWAGIDSIIIKVGNNRYTFSNLFTRCQVTDDNLANECIAFSLKTETLDFMKDLYSHSNEEIKVRLNGSVQNFDFVLSDSEKNMICGLYNLFVSGGGTRKSNLNFVSSNDKTQISLNGKIIS